MRKFILINKKSHETKVLFKQDACSCYYWTHSDDSGEFIIKFNTLEDAMKDYLNYIEESL